jgi:diguanylate cyclase (GGDEF)-like protein
MDPRAPGSGGSAVRAAGPRSGLSLPSLGRTLGVLYVCGGLVAVLWLQAPHGGPRGDGTVLTMAVLAVVLGAVLTACAQRLTATSLHLVLAVIQLVIAVACVATARTDTDLRLFFLWATPYSALSFGPRAAAAHLAWTSLVATAAVVAVPGPVPRSAAAGLLLLLSTLCAAAVLVGVAARVLRRAEQVQRRQAASDALTGLGNRRTLLEALGEPAGPGVSALVLLDLDGFKAVNDRYGHARGDEVLQEVAARLTGVVRAGDVVCRLGGDEFAVVVRGLRDEQDARSLAERVSEVVDLLVDAQHVAADRASRPLPVRASTGVRLLGPDGPDPTTALRQADVALYASKTAGRATVVLWHDGMRRAGEELDELSEDLR